MGARRRSSVSRPWPAIGAVAEGVTDWSVGDAVVALLPATQLTGRAGMIRCSGCPWLSPRP
jgi:hypothetical protein